MMTYAAQAANQQSPLDALKTATDKETAQYKLEHALASGVGAGAVAGAKAGATGVTNPVTPNNSGVTSVSVGKSTGSIAGNNTSSNSSTETATPDTSIQDAYKAQMDAANERLKQAYEFQQSQLQAAKDEAFREAYIKQQMVERGYPEQLAAAGIRGGAAQGLIARNNADYAKQRTGVYNNYMSGLATAGQDYQQGVMQSNENYLANMAAYEEAIKKMAIQHEYDKELAQLKASLA